MKVFTVKTHNIGVIEVKAETVEFIPHHAVYFKDAEGAVVGAVAATEWCSVLSAEAK